MLTLFVIFATRAIILFEEAEKLSYPKSKRDKLNLHATFSLIMVIASVSCLLVGFSAIPLIGFTLKWKTVGIIYSGAISLFWIAVLTIRWTKTSLIMED